MFQAKRRFVFGVYGRVAETDHYEPPAKMKRYVIDCGPDTPTHYAHNQKELDFVLDMYPNATVKDLEADNDN